MAGGILYLDIDDEITSAASRIRDADGTRVALVVPYGSRVATSRINFRLLSRDATTHRKQLTIVATDPATRALAASAGLPVFSTVGEYESSLAEGEGGAPTTTAEDAVPAIADGPAAGRDGDLVVGPDEGPVAGETARVQTGTARPRTGARARSTPPPGQATLDEMEAEELRSAAAALAAEPRSTPARAAANPTTDTPRPRPAARPFEPDLPVRTGPRPDRAAPATSRTRTPLLVGVAVLALIVLVGVVAGYLLLPSATAVITPKREAVGPIGITVVADPGVTQPDPAKGIVPAMTVSIDVVASQTFTSTGKRVDQQPATGSVTFRNLDPTSSNTIPKGSVVSTPQGIKFKTDQTLSIGRASLVGLQIIPRSASVSVTAVKPGPEANVPANAITVVPPNEDPLFLKVQNQNDTAGGARTEFPKIAQADLDAATAALQTALQTDFNAKLADPATAPVGSTVFTGTAILGTAMLSVDPSTLLDQEVATFDLGMTATGTVTAVDEAPVRSVAEQQIRTHIDAAHRLVDGSVEVTVQPAVVTGGRVTFPASVRALQTALLDVTAIREQVKGRPIAEARSILEGYGTVVLSVWPDWVSSVPTIDGRIDLTVDQAVPVVTPGSTPSAAP